MFSSSNNRSPPNPNTRGLFSQSILPDNTSSLFSQTPNSGGLFRNNSPVNQNSLFALPTHNESRNIFRESNGRGQSIFGDNASQDKKTKLFQDKNSPWHKSTEKVKSQFVLESINNDIAQITKIKDPCKVNDNTSPNICLRYILDDKYYKCWTCMKLRKKTEVQFGICKNCFVEEQHLGHNWQFAKVTRSLFSQSKEVMCLCGGNLFDGDSLGIQCQKHSPANKGLTSTNQEAQQFLEFWGSLLEIYIYLVFEKGHQFAFELVGLSIYKELEAIVFNNLTHCRLVSQLLFTKMNVPQNKENQPRILIDLFFEQGLQTQLVNKTAKKFVENMMQDLEFADKVVKYLCQKENHHRLDLQMEIIKVIRFRKELTFQLVQANRTEFLTFEDIALTIQHFRSPELLCKYVNNLLKVEGDDPEVKFQKMTDCLNFFALMKIGRLIKSVSKMLLLKFLSSWKNQRESCEVMQSSNFRKFINKILVSLCDCDAQKMFSFFANIGQYFPQTQEQAEIAENLFQFVQYSFTDTKGISYPHLMLALGHKEKDRILEKYFQNMFHLDQASTFKNKHCYETSSLTYILVIILHHRLFFGKYEDIPFQNDNFYQHQRNYRQQILKQCIYEFKSFPISQALFDEFRLPNLSGIIKEMTTHEFQSSLFFFNENSEHSNKLVIFLAHFFNKQIRELLLNNFNVNSVELFKNLSPFQQKLVDAALVNGPLFGQLQNFWNQLVKQSNNDPQSSLSQNMVLTLVLVELFGLGKHEKIHSQLEKYKQSRQEREILYRYGTRTTIDFLLGINEQKVRDEEEPSTQMGDLQLQKKLKEEKLKEAQKKMREKKYNRMKEKRNNFLEKSSEIGTTSLNRQLSEDTENCIVCHEKEKANNRYVYLVQIISKYTNAASLFDLHDKAQTKLSTCFHPIHFNCYMKEFETRQISSCPLCSKPINVFLPQDYDLSEYRMNNTCRNIIINKFFRDYKVFDFDNIFMVLFKHLLESKSFYSLINIDKYEKGKKIRSKTDFYVERLLTQMYETAAKQLRSNYDKGIELLLEEINTVTLEPYKLIQQIFVTGIWANLKSQQVSTEKIEELSKMINHEEFMIIKSEAEQLGIVGEFQEGKEQMETKINISKKYPLKPPKLSHEIHSFGEKKCRYCSSEWREWVCLVCGATGCGKCKESNQHEQNHQQKSLTLLVAEGKLSFNSDRQTRPSGSLFGQHTGQSVKDLYYNDLMFGYSQITYPLNNKDVYRLNEAIFTQFENKLLN